MPTLNISGQFLEPPKWTRKLTTITSSIDTHASGLVLHFYPPTPGFSPHDQKCPLTCGRTAVLPYTAIITALSGPQSPAGRLLCRAPLRPVTVLLNPRPQWRLSHGFGAPESGRRTISPITDAGRLNTGHRTVDSRTVDSRTVDSGTHDNAARARSPSGVAPGRGSSCPLRYPADQGSERSGRGQMVSVRSQADRSQLGKQPAAGGRSGRLAGVGVRVWVASGGGTWHRTAGAAWVSRSL